MKTVNMHQAKTQLSQLVEEVEAGAEILIARAGRPVARLVGIGSRGVRLGVAKGLVRSIAADFDAPLDPQVLLQPVAPRARRKK